MRDEWLTTVQAGELVGFSSDWVRDQVLSGRLKADVYLPSSRRTIRIRRSDFDQFRRQYMTTTGGDR